MNWDQLKNPLSYLCLPGTVVGSLSLTQVLAGSNTVISLTKTCLQFYGICRFYRIQSGTRHPPITLQGNSDIDPHPYPRLTDHARLDLA